MWRRRAIWGTALLSSTLLNANPTGENILAGEVIIQQESPSSMSVQASDRAIIEWNSFSIQSHESLKFIQPSQDSTLLNRVSGVDPTELFGSLESNGMIYLINPQGILFGENAVIDVGSLVASTFDISNDAFTLASELVFKGDSTSSIVHLGTIHANEGSIVLLAHRIENHGVIDAPKGTIAMGAGHEMLLQLEGNQLIFVRPTGAAAEGIISDGSLAGIRVELQSHSHPHELGIQLDGVVDALQVSQKGGEIYLRAVGGPLKIEKTASLQANKGSILLDLENSYAICNGTLKSQDGKIAILSQSAYENLSDQSPVILNGVLDVSGQGIGSIDVQAAKFLNSGLIKADGMETGGSINFKVLGAYVDTETSEIRTNGIKQGGKISILGNSSIFTSGLHRASGDKGGTIELSGGIIRMAAATLDVRGEKKDGSIELKADKPIEMNDHTALLADRSRRGGKISFRVGDRSFNGGTIFTLRSLPLTQENIQDTGCICPITEFVDPNPTGVNSSFGEIIKPLPNGNVVISKPTDTFGGTDAGAVYLYNGSTGALISKLLGSFADDRVSSNGITVLTGGDYVVASSLWNNGIVMGRFGAATWRSSTGTVTENVTTLNSMHGTTINDQVGGSVTALTNGNAVVGSPGWHIGPSQVGAATLMRADGTDALGVFAAVVGVGNSLVGGPNDSASNSGVLALINGNAIILSQSWTASTGAATFMNGTTGRDGLGAFSVITALNSLVGSNPGDLVSFAGGKALATGHAVITSVNWNGAVGAATWINGTNGTDGNGTYGAVSNGTYPVVGLSNSIYGSAPGEFTGSVVALTNGNAIIFSGGWNGGRGAATWMNGNNGKDGSVVPGFNVISASNSIIGTVAGDGVGSIAIALTNGHALIESSPWNAGRGAVTWINGNTGHDAFGSFNVVSTMNSVTGAAPGDGLGWQGIALTNGNAAISANLWNGGLGAVIWINGADGTDANGGYNVVSASNSITGTFPGDRVGDYEPVALFNGNYVIPTPAWNSTKGAATWANGTTGKDNLGGFNSVTAENSLVGSVSTDAVGTGVRAAPNGNYIVFSADWSGGTGALTLGNGIDGTYCGSCGEINVLNSIIGPNPGSILGVGSSDHPADLVNQTFYYRFSNYGGETRVFSSSYLGCFTRPTIIAGDMVHEYLVAISEAFQRWTYSSLGGYLEQDLYPPSNTAKDLIIRIPSLVTEDRFPPTTITRKEAAL